VSATDRTTGRQQSVSIQGGTNLSEEEITRLLEEAERKAAEDRRRRVSIDRRNRAQTLVSQAERRLRDAALELGPYGAERQQRSVELALRDVQELLGDGDSPELELAVSQLQEALFGLNRRLLSERRAESGPLQGIKNTLGSLRDELFSDDDWDDWDRDGRGDPWATPPRRPAAERFGEGPLGGFATGLGRGGLDDYQRPVRDREDGRRFGTGSAGRFAGDGGSYGDGAYGGDSFGRPRQGPRDPGPIDRLEDRGSTGYSTDEPERRRYGAPSAGDSSWPESAQEPTFRSPQPRRRPALDPDDPWADG